MNDGQNVVPAQIVGSTVEKRKLRPMQKTEAKDLVAFLRAQNPVDCLAVLNNLDNFIDDPDRQQIEILADGVDSSTRKCLDLASVRLREILGSRDAGAKTPGSATTVETPPKPYKRGE